MLGPTLVRRCIHLIQLVGKGSRKSVRANTTPSLQPLTSTKVPVYLDHLVVPTLTDEGCYTEVHHIDGAGHDAGYVLNPGSKSATKLS